MAATTSPSAALDAPPRGACLNCGAHLHGAYCATCGQRAPHSDLTLREFLHETTEELTHWDGKVPRTLKTLFTKPGALTLDFLDGRRARWMPPLRVYIICSLAFFLSKPIVEGMTHRSMRESAKFTLTKENRPLTDAERRELAQGIPGRIFGVERLEHAAADNRRLNRAIDSAFPNAMFVLMPLFALLTKLAWRKKGWRYPAHLYMSLHLHAAWFGALALATIASAPIASDSGMRAVGVAGVAYIIWYALVTLRRVFGESWLKTLGKAIAIAPFYLASVGAMALLLLGYAIYTM